MTWTAFFRRGTETLRSVFHLFVLSIGAIMTMTPIVNAASVFKVKPSTYYFDNEKNLALLDAALAGNFGVATQLVVEGANPNAEGPTSNPYNRLRLLHYAIAVNNSKAVKVLVTLGADPELNTPGGAGPAYLFAINLENLDALSVLLDLRPVESLSKDTIRHLLFESVVLSRPRCLELLLKRGAPIDARDKSGYTVMMRAIDAQDYEMAEWLLKQGASVHIEAKGGMTPAYSIQYDLQKFKPGSPTRNKVLHLKKLMEERGAVFPAPSPEEVRAKRAKQ